MFRRPLLIVLAVLFAIPCRAEVARIEVKSRADLLAAKAFGPAGAYEKLSGEPSGSASIALNPSG